MAIQSNLQKPNKARTSKIKFKDIIPFSPETKKDTIKIKGL